MFNYHLVSVWKLKAYQEDAWKKICDQEKWMNWWPGIKKVSVVNDEAKNGTGKTFHHTWSGILLSDFNCDLCITASEKPYLVEATASGELEGKIKWLIKQDGDTTTLTCTADLHIEKPWINKWESYLKNLFLRNYDALMQKGARALSKRLQTKFVVCKNTLQTQQVLPVQQSKQVAVS